MRPGESEFPELRLAAKAADRQKAARERWPVFEARLRALGYSPRAIAHAFSVLSGSGTVDEALQVLERTDRSSAPVALRFVVHDPPGNYSTGKGLTITFVERDSNVLRVGYNLGVMPFAVDHALAAQRPRFEAKDDLGNSYRDVGGHFLGLAANHDPVPASAGACGGFTLALPDPAACELRIRMSWNPTLRALWDEPARETVVSLQS